MCNPIPVSITDFKDLVLSLAGVITAGAAGFGLHTWNRQLRGTADFEVARALAKATYRLRDTMQSCRSPLFLGGEFPEGYKRSSPRQALEDANAYAHAFNARLQPVFSALQEFDTQTLEAEALWGQSVRTKTDDLRLQFQKMRVAIQAFIDTEYSGGDIFKSDVSFGNRMRADVAAVPQSDGNALSTSIDAAIVAIEAELKPHLKRR